VAGSDTVLLVSHGSPEPEANEQFLKFRDMVRHRQPRVRVEGAFLERARPDFLEVLQDLLAEGVTNVAVMPCFLFPGGHVSEDIPALIQEVVRKRFGAQVHYGATLSEHPAVADILVEQIPADTLNETTARIILVAAGSIALANRETVERLVAEIQKRTGLSTSYGYLDQGEPLIDVALVHVAKEDTKRLVVLPCLLFRGVYLRSVQRTIERFHMSYPDIEVTLGEPFGLDPRLAVVVEQAALQLLSKGNSG